MLVGHSMQKPLFRGYTVRAILSTQTTMYKAVLKYFVKSWFRTKAFLKTSCDGLRKQRLERQTLEAPGEKGFVSRDI